MTLFSRVRPVFQRMWAELLHATGCLWWVKRQLRRRGAVVVLTFHRVLQDAELRRTCSLPAVVLRARTFEKLAAYVTRKDAAMDFDDATGRAPGGRLTMVFTFDDGWKDTRTNALPVALRYGIPLTVFICPGLIGRSFPFWPEQVTALLRGGAAPLPDAEIERTIEALKAQTPARRGQLIAGLRAGSPHPGADCGSRTAAWAYIV